MVHAHQNLNGSRALTTPPPQGWVAIYEFRLATNNLFEVSISTHYKDIN